MDATLMQLRTKVGPDDRERPFPAVRSQSWCADLRRGRRSNPTDSERVVPEFLRHPAQNPRVPAPPCKNPRVPAPIRARGSVQRALFTRDEGTSAGWLKNCGMSGAGTVGQGAGTMGSYTRSQQARRSPEVNKPGGGRAGRGCRTRGRVNQDVAFATTLVLQR